MVATFDRSYPATFHPFQAALLAGSIPLFLGAMLCDIAYAKTYEVQWTIFASWLIAGGLVLGAVVLVLAVVDVFRGSHRGSRRLVYFLLVLATWVLGLVNALVHAKDVWAAMPDGLVLSVVVTVLACAATWLAFSGLRAGGAV